MKLQITAKVVKQQADEASTDTVAQYLAGDQCDASVRQYIDAALADNTLRAYRADLQHFIAWCCVIPATPEQVASYLAQHATRAVVAVPAVELSTEDARKALPKEVPMKDAVYNLSRSALLAASWATGNWDNLPWAMDDRLHQPGHVVLGCF